VDDSANERVFEFPSSLRWLRTGAPVFCGVLILGELLAHAINLLPITVLMMLILAFQYISVRRMRDRVAVSDDGIRYLPYAAEPTLLRWNEVAKLELRDGSLGGQLVVSDAVGLGKITIDYRMNEFQDLLSIVVDRATNCDPHPSLPSTFHASYLEQTVVVIVFFVSIGCSIHFARTGQSTTASAFGMFALLPVGMLAALPHSMTVSTDSITLNYLGWQRQIAVASLTGVRFGVERGGRGSIWTVLWLDRIDGRPVKLQGFSADSMAIYYCVHGAWQTARGSGLVQAAQNTR
jgi:hypothetical protein